MIKNCNTCRYEYRSSSEKPCCNCGAGYSGWEEKTGMKPTLEELLKQREDLDKKIEETTISTRLDKLKTLSKLGFIYYDINIERTGDNYDALLDIYEKPLEHYIKVSDLLTAIEEGRLKIDESN